MFLSQFIKNYSTNARWTKLLDSGRGAEHPVGYHKFIFDKLECME